MPRTSREIATQAICFGTLGFRAALEVSEHPRGEVLCSQLMPWLTQQNLADHLEELHREILKTPYQKLPREALTEAYWRGEGASCLGWAIQLCDLPDRFSSVDPGDLVDRLQILQPNASELVAKASLRSLGEVQDFCAFCLAIRHHDQLAALNDNGPAILWRIQQSHLAELGLTAARDRQATEIDAAIAQFASGEQSVRGLYTVRALTCEWLLADDESPPSETRYRISGL